MLTQQRLKEILKYNPETGIFTWLVNAGSARKGKVAGSVNGNGYITIAVSGVSYRAHRLAYLYMEGEFPPEQIDHINGVRDDNRYDNLRAVSAKENQRNASKRADNTSGITGVSWCNTYNKWFSSIKAGGRKKFIGRYDDFFEACCARKSAEKKYGFHPNHGREA